MPRPPTSPEQRDRERQRLRHVAAEIIQEEGISAVTVRAVTSRAGVSQGTLYNYFSNLHELVRSLWMEPVAKAGKRLEAIAAEVPDPVERITAILEAYVEFARRFPEVHRGVFLFVRPDSLPRPDAQAPEALPFFAELRRGIEDGQALGDVKDGDARLMAQVLWSGVHGALGLPINTEGYTLAAAEEVVPVMVDLLVKSITLDR